MYTFKMHGYERRRNVPTYSFVWAIALWTNIASKENLKATSALEVINFGFDNSL
jgi:hypothetical protein